jgi:predicted transcriptional regulator
VGATASANDGSVTLTLTPASAPRGARAESLAHALVPAAQRAAPPAIAAVGLLALLQALGAFRFAGLGAFALYSRLTRSNLLDNEHRDRVYKLIQETPGLNVSEIGKRTRLGWGTTVYHLDRLEREGFVAAERGGLHKCYFAVGLVDRDARKAAAQLKDGPRRDVAAVLLATPGITQGELATALGMSPSAASKQVTKLEAAGLVRRERDWKTVRLYPGPALAANAGGGAGTGAGAVAAVA